MNKIPLNGLSTMELQNTKKTTVVITVLLTVMLFVLLIMAIYTSVTKGFSTLLAIPSALSPIAILNFRRIKEINTELKLRNGR